MELIEDLTRGNVSQVNLVLASVVPALTVSQLGVGEG